MSLAEGVLQLIEDARRRQAFARVLSVHLEVGALAGVEPEAMRFCFDAVTRGTVAGGARLEILAVPGTGSCMGCGETVEMKELYGDCPRCGSAQVQVTGGTELRVSELEVE
ncbi:hydrogenase maturation nickel metallochaperone HypA [Ramlibacter sp. AN1133]|uniref:hydrogenase maturation nickel metallochaperone HypA n=1 Tax=Ramlibacter sp. AN1133 TaxID=3133429 RepID=UPI0030C59CBF